MKNKLLRCCTITYILIYTQTYCLSNETLDFWATQAQHLDWFSPWTHILDFKLPYAHWFVNGKLNASHLCLDTHINKGFGTSVAIIAESENGTQSTITYKELYDMVNAMSNTLLQHGVSNGDIVIIYMPMIAEAIAAMLACARIGAIHSVVFSGFSAAALKDRINDTHAHFVITSDIANYRGKESMLKATVDEAIKDNATIQTVFVIKRKHDQGILFNSRDVLLNKGLDTRYVIPIAVESNHPLFILYTSGTTGKPKGIIHGTGGYLTYVYSTIKWAFDIKRSDVYWCTADIGWITGHSYGVYGPLMHGATILIREGAPDFPDVKQWWKLIDKHHVSIFYTSPTALRMFMRLGSDIFKNTHLNSLRILGSVGEPINPEVWTWYHETIGHKNCPIIDTWWQTETGGFMIAPMACRTSYLLKPGSATLPMPTIDAVIVDNEGNSVSHGTKGFLVIKSPWPGMALGIHNGGPLFEKLYWSRFTGMYYTGDYAIQDNDGYFWLLGRADEIIKVSGHRIGTAELESAVQEHAGVAENAAIGVNDDIKGQAIVFFIVLKKNYQQTSRTEQEITELIRKSIGSFATPKKIYFVEKLPKTRSGKIMRRLLKALVEGLSIGDASTLEDGASIEELQHIVNLTVRYLPWHY